MTSKKHTTLLKRRVKLLGRYRRLDDRIGELMSQRADLESEIADLSRELTRIELLDPKNRHVCCGCGGLCDSGVSCPMAHNCQCITT